VTVALALILSMVLPGLALGAVLTPVPAAGEFRPGVLFGRSLAAGVVAWLVISGLCARLDAVTTTVSWSVDAIVGAVSLGVLALPRCRRVLPAAWRDYLFGAGLAVLSLVVWLPIGLLNLRTSWAVLGSTPWYYWDLARQVAQAGHVPARSVEWGTSVPFLDDYHLFTTATASLLTQSHGTGITAVRAIIVISVIITGCGAALVAASFGAGPIGAACAVPVAIGLDWLAVKLTSYRPEAFATGLALLAVAAAVDYLRHRERGALVVAVGAVAALAEVHGIVLIVALCMIVAAVFALAPMRRRRLLRYLRTVAVLAVTTAGATVALALIMGTRPGAEHVGKLDDVGGLADPTWRFVRAIRGLGPSDPPSNWQITKAALTTSFDGMSGWWVVGLIAAAVLVLLVRAVREPMARRILVFIVVFLVVLAVPTWLFATGWTSYVPRRTGSQRLVQSSLLIVAPVVACGCAAFLPWRRFPALRRCVEIAVVVGLAVVAYRSSAALEPSTASQRPTADIARTLRNLDVPPGAVILANGYTESYFAMLTGGHGLLDGRAPYTFPKVLVRANALLTEAADFYRDPRANLEFLKDEHVDFVIVARDGQKVLATWNHFVFAVPRSRFDGLEQLRLVAATPDLIVYRFTG
jgi:hypothetical protein